MEKPPPEPILYEGITIGTFDRQKPLRELIQADRQIFSDHRGIDQTGRVR